MPRPKRIRKMINPPHFKGFRPIGKADDQQVVLLNFEEYESIRLCDYELMGQLEASQAMEVSRPTFTRIYESARRKVAQAFVEGKAIIFEGGKVYFDSEWYACMSCGCWFNHPEKDSAVGCCPLCGSTSIEQSIVPDDELDIYLCPHCGKKHEVKNTIDNSSDFECQNCQQLLVRKQRKSCKRRACK